MLHPPNTGKTSLLGLFVTVFCGLIASGCATTVSSSGNPEITAALRPADSLPFDDEASRHIRARQRFLRGMTEARLGHYEAALNLYAEALQLVPDTPAILAATAEAHAYLGDESTALYHLAHARSLAPENLHYAMQLADLYVSANRTKEAALLYADVLERSPQNPEALHALARVHAMQGDLVRSVAAYERLLEMAGPDRDIRNRILHIHARLGDLEGMERTLRSMVEAQPREASLRRMLADTYRRQGRHREAAAELKDALTGDPGDRQTIEMLAETYRGMGMTTEADSLMQWAALPGFDNEASETLYRRLREHPRDLDLWIHLADTFFQSGRSERAASVVEEGLVLFPGNLPLLKIAGSALMDLHRNEEAIRHFEEALRIAREDDVGDPVSIAELHTTLGLLYLRQEDMERSSRAFEQALEAVPDHVAALNHYAYSLAQQEAELDRALEMARRAVILDPEAPTTWSTLGWVLYRLGNVEEALLHVERAAEHPGASVRVLGHLAEIYEALGQKASAREARLRARKISRNRR